MGTSSRRARRRRKRERSRVRNESPRATPAARHFCIALAILTLLLYVPAAWHGYFHYDDDLYVIDNAHLAGGITPAGIAWAFRSSYASNWHPLTWLSHMLDRQLFGASPGPQHLVNVLLHTANSVLLFLALLRMTRRPWPSATVAALFAWHPAHVESVAWIAERKDVLSGFFFFLTLLAYARHAEQPSVRRFGFVALFFALGLMAKPMLVTLPFVLLLLDYWPLERLRAPAQLRHLAVEKIPLFALSAASCLVTFIVQKSSGAVMPLEYVSIYARLGNAVISYARYLGILLWPARLIVPYRPSHDLDALAISLAAVALVSVTTAVVKFGARRKFFPVGWFWYLGTLMPVIGIVQVGSQAMADRYTYIPSIGIFIIIAWGVAEILPRRVCAVTGVAALAILPALTARQLSFWKNSETLFQHTLAVEPENLDALNGLAWTYATDLDPKLRDGKKAVELAERCVSTTHWRVASYLDTLSAAYSEAGDFKHAVETAQQALTLPAVEPLVIADIREHIKIYEARKAIHAP